MQRTMVLIKSKWQWINITKHLYILLVLFNLMFQIGSADSNSEQVQSEDEIINMKLRAIKQMADNVKIQLKNITISATESGQLSTTVSLNAKNIENQDFILNKIKQLEENITTLAGNAGDSENTKVRMNDLENLKKSLDCTFKENLQYQNKLEETLANMTRAYNDIAERFLIIEEPRRLKELEEQLLKREYRQAKLTADSISNDRKIIEVMEEVFEEHGDIDGYLYFAGIVNNLSRRLLIYRYIFKDILKDCCSSDLFDSTLITYYLLLWYKIDAAVTMIAPESTELYRSANSLTESIKSYLQRLFSTNTILKLNNTALAKVVQLCYFDYNCVVVEWKYYLDIINDEKIDRCLDVTIPFYNRDTIFSALLEKNNKGRSYSIFYPIVDTEIMICGYYIKEQEHSKALNCYNRLRSNSGHRKLVIDSVYKRFHDVDSIIDFANLLQQNDHVEIYSALYDAINKTDIVNICDMLKLHESLVNSNNTKLNTLIIDLKKAITLVIKEDDYLIQLFPLKYNDIKNYTLITGSNFNKIRIYSRDDTNIIATNEFYLVKENGKNICNFNGKIFLENYGNWFEKYFTKDESMKKSIAYHLLKLLKAVTSKLLLSRLDVI